MNYVNVNVLVSKLKYGRRFSEFVGNCAKREVCFRRCCGACAFSTGLSSLERDGNRNVGIFFKRHYNAVAHRGNSGNNCGESGDYQLSVVRHTLHAFVRRMAGHSKWQNIRHIKAAKDHEKSLTIQWYAVAIRRAVLEGGANPKSNTKLAQLLEEAKRNNVPNATIERTIAKAKATPSKPAVMEIQGPGGCLLVLEGETGNADRFVHDVKIICRKFGALILPKGRVHSVYDQKGIITVNATKDNSPLDCAKATDIAIEAGAEDVQEIESDNEGKALQFFCDPDDLYAVKKHIESTNYVVNDAAIMYIAKDNAKVDLNNEQMNVVESLYNQLEKLPEVTCIYDNINEKK